MATPSVAQVEAAVRESQRHRGGVYAMGAYRCPCGEVVPVVQESAVATEAQHVMFEVLRVALGAPGRVS